MSDATKAALDAAISAHLADECSEAVVTGYVLQTQYVTPELMGDEQTGYLRMVAEGQSFTTTLGLAAVAHHRLSVIAGEG